MVILKGVLKACKALYWLVKLYIGLCVGLACFLLLCVVYRVVCCTWLRACWLSIDYLVGCLL